MQVKRRRYLVPSSKVSKQKVSDEKLSVRHDISVNPVALGRARKISGEIRKCTRVVGEHQFMGGVMKSRKSAALLFVCMLAASSLSLSGLLLSQEVHPGNSTSANAEREKAINNDLEANEPLTRKASGEQLWQRIIKLLNFPHGLITADNIQAVFGNSIYYSNRDSSGYTASFADIRGKNYSLVIIYLYRALPLQRRYSTGPTSTVSINFPTSDCLPIARADEKLLGRGMHYSGELIPPVSQAMLYRYPDGNGGIQVDYVKRRVVGTQTTSACVSSVTISGSVESK